MAMLYLEWLQTLEHSGLGHAARHSAWLYTLANLFHVLGAALLVGGIAVFDLALLTGRYDGASLIGRIAIPLAALGLVLQIPTGLTLLSAEAQALGTNPAYFAKMGFIALGFINLAIFHGRVGSAMTLGSLGPRDRIFAFISLTAWIATLLCGRLIAYL